MSKFFNIVVEVLWMAWVLILGFAEALIHIWYPNVYLIIDEDKWNVRVLR